MSLEVLAAWRGLLADLGALGEVLCRAIDAGDVQAAIAAMIRLRQLRSDLVRVEAPVVLRGDPHELAAIREVSALAARARAAEAAMAAWLARPVPGDATLLASPLGTAALADAILPAVWDFETDLVVLVGAGLEPVAELLAALGQRRIVHHGAAGATPTGGAIATESIDEVTAAVRTCVPTPPAHLVVHAISGTERALVEQVTDAAKTALSDLRIHRNTVRAFSRTWIEQGAANLPAVARWPSIASVGDAFAGRPMVIVAPGPSLARNVDQLRAIDGRAIITAFSHSLKPVLAAGVVPDFVVTVDPQDVRYHFAGCDVGQTCLVNAATVHPALFELPAARFLTLSANCAIDDWIFDGLDEQALVPGGGSVATTAFSLALRWGCDPIVFVGLDLSFPGGSYYVATSSDGDARARVDERGVMSVDGWSTGFRAMKSSGGPELSTERAIELPAWHAGASGAPATVPSSFMFSLFHRWFVDRMRFVTGVAVYNCTEGGAYIDGMTHRPLAEVVATLSGARPIDVAGVLDATIAAAGASDRGRRLAGHLAGYVHGLRRSRKLAVRARQLIAAGETAGQLERVERALAAALRPLGFASLLAQREVERAQDISRRDGTCADFLAASTALMTTLATVIDQLEPALAAALARLPPGDRARQQSGRRHGHAA